MLLQNVKPEHGFIYSGASPFVMAGFGGATAQDNITINDNYDFGWYYWLIAVYQTGTATEIPFPNVTLLLQTNNYKYFNKPLNVSLLGGNGQEANYQVVPYYARRNNKLLLEYTNNEAVGIDIYTQLQGFEAKAVPSYI